MSSRQLRKLQKQRELEEKTNHELEEESDGAEESGPSTSKPRMNLFAALGGDEDDPQDEEEQENEDIQQGVKETAAPTSAKKSKKKTKKKKGKAAAATLEVGGGEQSDEDEIDRAMKELKIKPQHDDASSETNTTPQAILAKDEGLLKINLYHLKVIHEMRNLFGREVIESANAEEEQEQNRRGRRGPVRQQVDLETFLREPPGAKKLPEVSLRRNIFVQGREHWPLRTTGGLTMKEIGKGPNGSWTEYAYFHGEEYDGIQMFFFACVQLGDPMRMVHLLKEVPYHISTLLQVSSVAKQDQNMALAAELCERALFTFGRVATSSFRQNIEQGKARLDFRRPENRQFWLAGYHYLKSLIRKGTYRTALEWAKLLFTLDITDPYAMRYFIHFLAIRAYESSWLLSFLDLLERLDGSGDAVYIQQSRVLARLQIGDTEQAKQDLTSGMHRVPWLYCALFQELNLDAPPSIWGISTDSDARSFWVKLYLHHTMDLWNNAQATALLQDVARSMSRVDVASLPKDDPPVGLGPTRLAYLEGQTSLLALVPRDLLDRQPNYEFDPLPPTEEDNIFTGEGTKLPWQDKRQQQAPGGLNDLLARMVAMRGAEPANAGVPGVPGMPGMAAEDFDALEALDTLDTDDEELRQDIAAQVAGGEEPGVLAAFLRMFGLGGNNNSGNQGDEGNEHLETGDGLPGSWPAEDTGSGERPPGL